MKPKIRYGFSNGIRLFVCTMAVFFSFLAIVDSFQKKAEIIYAGEFVSEADFKFIELPSIVRYLSGNKISKIEKIEVIQPLKSVVYSSLEAPSIESRSVAEAVHIFFPISSIFRHSLNTNAP
ncbi:hypothetical protein [Cognataquiflexum rubidum]|uniref:hypothetical protein n=1 Tax=Cognataquiflexum rubidum TaxID=2922273 RepID=UPI001F14122C|nr:hypothetical protein [Cognataquiflexum rubidum]MCH6233001.1 hypothetical protein [Cognataquiflexum rubidum]